MKYIDIIPKINDGVFTAKIMLSDKSIETPLFIRVVSRRNDGLYQTSEISYPSSENENKDFLSLVFFEMGKSHVAQIIDVKINNIQIYPSYTDIASETTARYDDSLTRVNSGRNYENIDINFQVSSNDDPRILLVSDYSTWGAIENKPAVIDIVLPGFKEPLSFYLGKNQVNEFNSITLGLSCVNNNTICLEDLPDGIYDITVKGSPSTFNYSRKYLKTDATRIKLDKIYAKASVGDDIDTNLIEKINEIEFILSSAHACMRLGLIEKCHDLLQMSEKLMKEVNKCKDC